MPIEPIILLDISRSEIRDSIKMRGSSKNRGELGKKKRRDNSNK